MPVSDEDINPLSIFAVDNFVHAKDVIKSLRSSSNSSRQYKQNAVSDSHIIDNLEQFNKVVQEKVAVSSQAKLDEDRINESISKFQPPIRYIPKQNNGHILNTLPSPNNNRQDEEDDIDFSSDDEFTKPVKISPVRQFNLINFDHHLIFFFSTEQTEQQQQSLRRGRRS